MVRPATMAGVSQGLLAQSPPVANRLLGSFTQRIRVASYFRAGLWGRHLRGRLRGWHLRHRLRDRHG